ncbi:unnamed protein product [Adineta ricciae]|uniref:DUF2059 domain-containing protein n=1 Tax=Adineta ricciae TaxID=249248 RepID=A0A815SKV5_ADIRI|nr:unnamed protein product [Adineta ricciae]
MSKHWYFLLLFVLLSIEVESKPAATKININRQINRLLNITEMEKKFDNVLQSLIVNDPTLSTFKSEIMKFINTFFSFKSLRPQIVEIYRDLYTSSDITGLIKFYSSSLGKKFLEKETEAAVRFNQLVQNKLQAQMPQIMNWFQQMFYKNLANNQTTYGN